MIVRDFDEQSGGRPRRVHIVNIHAVDGDQAHHERVELNCTTRDEGGKYVLRQAGCGQRKRFEVKPISQRRHDRRERER